MMSKTWLIAAAWLLTSVAASAQEPEAWRPKYVNLSFVSQKLDFGEGEKIKSRFGAWSGLPNQKEASVCSTLFQKIQPACLHVSPT